MNDTSSAADDAKCLRAVANALAYNQDLIEFLRQLAPQWGSSTGKARSFRGLNVGEDPGVRCILRVDSRAAILLNDALYAFDGPSIQASQVAAVLRNPPIGESGIDCVIEAGGMEPIRIHIDEYADADGIAVAPDSPDCHHRVVSVAPA